MNWTAKQISNMCIRIERSHMHTVSYRVRCENPVSEMFYPGSTKVIEFNVPYVGVYTITQIPLIDNDLPISEQTVNVTNPITFTELEQLGKMWNKEIETKEPKVKPTPKKTRVPRKKKL